MEQELDNQEEQEVDLNEKEWTSAGLYMIRRSGAAEEKIRQIK